MKLYKLFVEKDCSLAEINPLIITGEGEVMALDAKLNFDDSAMYRHVELGELREAESTRVHTLRDEISGKDREIDILVSTDVLAM